MRKNPRKPWEQFTMCKCEKHGEFYEPYCELEHKCKKQNSYPIKVKGGQNAIK